MTDFQRDQEIEDIVERTVIKTLANIGIDLSTVEARREFIEDQLYTRAWRNAVQRSTKIGWGAFITILVTGMCSVLWVGFQAMFK